MRKSSVRVLVLGASGRVGRTLVESAPGVVGGRWIGAGRADFDCEDPESIRCVVRQSRCNVVINATGFTDVDRCEIDKARCDSVNCAAVRAMAAACVLSSARFVQLSTDYVFGDGPPFREEGSPPSPLNYYGSVKLAAERWVRDICSDYVIVRTAWLFGGGRPAFPEWVLKNLSYGRPFAVVRDRTGSPTRVEDFCTALAKLVVERPAGAVGIFHIVNRGFASWFDYAREVAACVGADAGLILPGLDSELQRRARRPSDSSLNCARLESLIGERMRSWDAALREHLAEGRWKAV